MASQEPQEQKILQDKLKEQISVSIAESLDKATSVLSSLHRVQSYLDVLKSLPSFRSGLKSALDQVRSIRTDAATLLQTIYLTEIGLQSLQDVDNKQGTAATNTASAATATPVALFPILGDSINSTRLPINSTGLPLSVPLSSDTFLHFLPSKHAGGLLYIVAIVLSLNTMYRKVPSKRPYLCNRPLLNFYVSDIWAVSMHYAGGANICRYHVSAPLVYFIVLALRKGGRSDSTLQYKDIIKFRNVYKQLQ